MKIRLSAFTLVVLACFLFAGCAATFSSSGLFSQETERATREWWKGHYDQNIMSIGTLSFEGDVPHTAIKSEGGIILLFD